jgi:hypothetical protein
MPVAWRAVIGEGVQARVPRQVIGLQGEGVLGWMTNKVGAEGGDRPDAIICLRRSIGGRIEGENGVLEQGVLQGRRTGGTGDTAAAAGRVVDQGAVGEGQAAVVEEAAAEEVSRVVGQGTVGERHSAEVVNAATAARGVPAPEREPLKGEGTSRGNLQEAKSRSTGGPFDAGGRCSISHNGQRAGNHRQAIGIGRSPVMNCCQGIGTRHQGNRLQCVESLLRIPCHRPSSCRNVVAYSRIGYGKVWTRQIPIGAVDK